MASRVQYLLVDRINAEGLHALGQWLSPTATLQTMVLRMRERSFGVSVSTQDDVLALERLCTQAPRLRSVYLELHLPPEPALLVCGG